MINQSDRLTGRVFIPWPTPLRTFLRILQGMQVTGITQHNSAHANTDPSLIHHMEHVSQAFIGLSNTVANRPTLPIWLEFTFPKIQQGVRRTAISHLVIQASQRHIISLTTTAIFIEQPSRHDEERNPFHARRASRHFCKHQVYNVLREFMITGRNPHLVAV